MADIGYIALFLALAVSVYSAIAYMLGGRNRSPVLLDSARNGLLASPVPNPPLPLRE